MQDGKRFEVNDSIWVAAAVMSYEIFHKKKTANESISLSDFTLIQANIRNRVNDITGRMPEGARTSQWCCGDHENHNYCYLREVDGNKRRLSFPGEFGGKEEPENLSMTEIINTKVGNVSLQELFDFVHGEYASLANQGVPKTSIDYKAPLDYLDKHAKESYSGPDKQASMPEKERSRIEVLIADARNAVNQIQSMTDLCEKKFKLKRTGAIKWLDGSNVKTKHYLWGQMKYQEKMDNPISISIFVDLNEDTLKARYRISLEIMNKDADKALMDKYHSYLELEPDFEHGLSYGEGTNERDYVTILSEDRDTVKQKIENGTYEKVQYCKIIERNGAFSNEEYENAVMEGVRALIPYYEYVVGIYNDAAPSKKDDNLSKDEDMRNDSFGHNMILYGPPGTGKTYNTAIYAVAICDSLNIKDVKAKPYDEVLKRYDELKGADRIAFTTFHQSYGYEEFIEGIKPKLDSDDDKLGYAIENGIFKEFCEKAKAVKVHSNPGSKIKENPHIWGMLLGGTGMTKVKRKCFDDGEIRLGWTEVKDGDVEGEFYGDEKVSWNAKHMVADFKNTMEIGDVVVIEKTTKSIDAIGVITGEYEYDTSEANYPRKRKVEWLVKDIDQGIMEYLPAGRKQMSRYSLYDFNYLGMEMVSQILNKNAVAPILEVEKEDKPYVFIIDEINRGNMSKIFGELITLIEETKRAGTKEAMEAILPYSGQAFSVPNNVYIIGTMNTADRSIALMDTALRRRFSFVEMMPDTKVLEDLNIGTITVDGQTLNVAEMLRVINQRIEYLFDREHTIGHAFFTKLVDDPSLNTLAEIFSKNVIPLLQEYFYEDYQKIQLVLGDNNKPDEFKFILDHQIKLNDIFNGNPEIDLPEKSYEIQKEAFTKIQSYKLVGKDL